MAEIRVNVIAKSNVTSSNIVKGTICRADVLRLIYERKNRFSDRVRLNDIDDILIAFNLKQSEAQTVENMIRGHRRKGFVDPPKPIADTASTELLKPSKIIEEKQRSPSPIIIECDLTTSPPPTTSEVRNKRLFDSSGFHDPKSALQPAKIRFRKMLSTSTEVTSQTLSNELKLSSISPPSPTPVSTIQSSTSLAESLQSQQKQPASTLLNRQNMQPLNSSEINKPLTIKRGRRIKITPRRDPLTNLSQKASGWPKQFLQHAPAIFHPSFPYACSQQRTILSELQPLDQSFIPPHHLHQSAIAQLLAHQQIFSARQYSTQQYFAPMMIQQPQNSLRNFFESYTP